MTPGPRNLLTDVDGVLVGHATDIALGSGVTAVLFEPAATISGLVLGGAPGGRETSLLEPEMTVESADAVVLSGGSAFGLDAAGGAMAWLREQGRGVPVRDIRVPIVPAAILMDLLGTGDKDWDVYPPYRDLGYEAIAAAGADFTLGSIGAGTGATTATVKGGIGSASAVTATGHVVAALLAVNAVGSATVGDTGFFWAAPHEVGEEFGGQGWPQPMPPDADALRAKGLATTLSPGPLGTTIGLVATDARLTKAQAKRLAIAAHDGLARAVLPAHLPGDGDTIFSAATGRRPLDDIRALAVLCHAATLVTARAAARGVFAATALPHAGAQPGWRDRFGG